MRVVIDTNIAVSGLLWGGPPRQIVNAAVANTLALFTSDELDDVFRRPKLASRFAAVQRTPLELLHEYRNITFVVVPMLITPTAADPDDDVVLACAPAAQADAIVSGDDHLLRFGSYQGIPILTASELLARLDSSAHL